MFKLSKSNAITFVVSLLFIVLYIHILCWLLPVTFCYFCVTILITLAISLISKFICLRLTKIKRSSFAFNHNQYDNRHFLYIYGCIPLVLVSPDFVITKFFKTMYRLDVDDKKKFIVFSNVINFLISFIVSTIFYKHSSCIWILLLICGRIVSRTFEIIVSFLIDVGSTNKSSSASTKIRICLAISSYVEIFLLLIALFKKDTDTSLSETLCNFFNTIMNRCDPVCSTDCSGTFLNVFVYVYSAIMITHIIGNYIGSRNQHDTSYGLFILPFIKKEFVFKEIEWDVIKLNLKDVLDNYYKENFIITKIKCPDYDEFVSSYLDKKMIIKQLYSIYGTDGSFIGTIFKKI